MTFVIAITLSLGIGWILFRRRQQRALANLDILARLSGHSDHTHLQASLALAARAGVAPTQARAHYAFLVEAFGEPAVAAAGRMILDGTFDRRFSGQSLEASLDHLSQELPDPKIDAIVARVLSGLEGTEGRTPVPQDLSKERAAPKKPTDDDLPF